MIAGQAASSSGRLGLAFAGGLLAVLLGASVTADAAVVLSAKDGSRRCIVMAVAAPSSVKKAAEELSRYLSASLGGTFPVVADAGSTGCGVIALGDTGLSRQSGIEPAVMPLDGFEIRTVGSRVVIAGNDTKDGGVTAYGGVSTGTLNGVYTFLEDYLGVRWLMPGEIGEHVPRHKRLVVPDLARKEEPVFLSRRLAYVQNDSPLVREWLQRQKHGYSVQLEHSHSWQYLIPQYEFERHPEWFAMINGRRVPPVGDRYKLETTDPGLVRALSDAVIQRFQVNARSYSQSISPTDSAGWSMSEASRKQHELDPRGRLSVTPLLLDFYRAVSGRVGGVFPNRKVCGYIYADYLYPPSQGIGGLPPNLCLVLAPDISYHFGLYRESSRAAWSNLLDEWSRTGALMAYYDLPVTLPQSIGAPNPLGLELLKVIYPRVASSGAKGIYIYGVDAWGHGALTNYVLAKLNWDPYADADHLAEEFCRLAYGPAAGRRIRDLYALLDRATRDYISQSKGAVDAVARQVIERVYVDQLAEIESLFFSAQSAVMTPAQKARLQWLGANLEEFYRYLQAEGLVVSTRQSPLRAASSLLGGPEPPLGMEYMRAPVDKRVLALGPVAVRHLEGLTHAPEQDRSAVLRGNVRAVLSPLASAEVRIRFVRLETRGEQLRYFLQNRAGTVIQRGIVNDEEEMTFRSSDAGFLSVLANEASFGLIVDGAAVAFDSRVQPRGFHFLADYTPSYFFVPETVQSFHVTVSGWRTTGINVVVELVAPDGTVRATADMRTQPSVRLRGDNLGHQGVWSVALRRANSAAFGDDAWIGLDERLSPWIFLDPKNPLVVGDQSGEGDVRHQGVPRP